jgi:hypothetical protein
MNLAVNHQLQISDRSLSHNIRNASLICASIKWVDRFVWFGPSFHNQQRRFQALPALSSGVPSSRNGLRSQ